MERTGDGAATTDGAAVTPPARPDPGTSGTGGAPDPHPARRPAHISVAEVWRAGLRTWWRHKWLLVLLGLVVFLPFAVVEDLADQALRRWAEGASTLVASLLVGASVVASSGQVLGLTFFSGLTDSLVGTHQHGHERHPLPHVARHLPYGRLLLAQLLVIGTVVVGVVLFIVPALVAFTLFAIAGPVVIVERRGPVSALGRSARLVRPVFWTTAAAVTVPVLVEGYLEDLLHLAHLTHLAELATECAVTAVVGSVVGVVEATLAHELMARDRAGVPARGVAAP